MKKIRAFCLVMWAVAMFCAFMAVETSSSGVSDKWWGRMGIILAGSICLPPIFGMTEIYRNNV